MIVRKPGAVLVKTIITETSRGLKYRNVPDLDHLTTPKKRKVEKVPKAPAKKRRQKEALRTLEDNSLEDGYEPVFMEPLEPMVKPTKVYGICNDLMSY